MDQRLLGLEAAPPRFQSREAMRNGRSRRVALSFLLLLQTSLSRFFHLSAELAAPVPPFVLHI